MITSATYTYVYTLNYTVSGSFTNCTHAEELFLSVGTISEHSGVIDGVSGAGDEVWHDFGDGASIYTYTGWTYNGAPILRCPISTQVYLFTNDPAVPSSGQATVSDYTYCFARHTLIATPAGERPVESLQRGDLVITEGKSVPVKWIGRQTRHPLFARMSGQLPVLIKVGALGGGLPKRDLYVSPDHAMLVDGVLVHALALVNGVSIVQMTDWPHENVEYFHIELENHELILAEGTPAETFVDNVSRKNFDNYEEFVSFYGEGSVVPELALPRVKNRRQLSKQTKKRLMEIALRSCAKVA